MTLHIPMKEVACCAIGIFLFCIIATLCIDNNKIPFSNRYISEGTDMSIYILYITIRIKCSIQN